MSTKQFLPLYGHTSSSELKFCKFEGGCAKNAQQYFSYKQQRNGTMPSVTAEVIQIASRSYTKSDTNSQMELHTLVQMLQHEPVVSHQLRVQPTMSWQSNGGSQCGCTEFETCCWTSYFIFFFTLFLPVSQFICEKTVRLYVRDHSLDSHDCYQLCGLLHIRVS